VVLEGVAVIPVFFRFYRNFSQEFLGDRNSCTIFTPDSSGIRRIPEDSCSCQKLLALASDKRRLFVK